jgi:hypothetical protein
MISVPSHECRINRKDKLSIHSPHSLMTAERDPRSDGDSDLDVFSWLAC